MAEKVRDLFSKARALLNIYTEDGIQKPEDDYIDLMEKAVPLADMAQRELFKIGKLYAVYEFDCKPHQNLLGMFNNFNAVDFVGIPQYYPNETGIAGAKAYYFEVTRDTAVVTIEENQGGTWVALTTPTITSGITSYTGFRGIITPTSSTNPIRMKFNGTTHYRHINRCLFSTPFTVADVPEYAPWVTKIMPDNFRTIDACIEEYPERQYANAINYKKEGFKTLKINYFFEGKFRVIYKPIPVAITDIDQELEIDDITAQAVVYYIAARLAPFKKKELVQYFEDKFMELKVESSQDTPVSTSDIIDVYGGRNNG
jgi:hypothetical protein